MIGQLTQRRRRGRRPAAALALTVVTLVVLFGFAALTVDVGAMYNTRADLQRAADAGALAAATALTGSPHADDPIFAAHQAAIEIVEQNLVLGRKVTIEPNRDVVLGRAWLDSTSNRYHFTPTDVLPDAVRVTVRKTEDSPNGPTNLFFARIFGRMFTDISATATAAITPRDIAIIVDLSGSLNNDSELQHYRLTEINLYEVWDALPGGVDEIGGTWNHNTLPEGWIEADGSAPQAAGPAWGFMRTLGFGSELDPGTYSPIEDPGLIQLEYRRVWREAELESFLVEQGYHTGEIANILAPDGDQGGGYANRVAVALGLAYWNSGRPDGLWNQRGVDASNTGNGDSYIDDSELEWVEPILSLSQDESVRVWRSYIDYMSSSRTSVTRTDSDFRYAYGIKTFVNYLMEQRYTHTQTPELADTPSQPMQAIKDAVEYLVDLVDHLNTNDQLSLEIYGTNALHEVDLTNDFHMVSDALKRRQPGHYDPWTNMGGGIEVAIDELRSERARRTARKVMILLTDGIANVNELGSVGDDEGGRAHAIAQAERAASLGIRLFTVSVGVGADQDLMKQIADIGHGVHFHAEGSIDQYSAGLAQIFVQIGRSRSAELIQ